MNSFSGFLTDKMTMSFSVILLLTAVEYLGVNCSTYCGADVPCKCIKNRAIQNCVSLDLVSFPTFYSDTSDIIESVSLQRNRIEYLDLDILLEQLPNIEYLDVSDQIGVDCVRGTLSVRARNILLVGFCPEIYQSAISLTPSSTSEMKTSTELSNTTPKPTKKYLKTSLPPSSTIKMTATIAPSKTSAHLTRKHVHSTTHQKLKTTLPPSSTIKMTATIAPSKTSAHLTRKHVHSTTHQKLKTTPPPSSKSLMSTTTTDKHLWGKERKGFKMFQKLNTVTPGTSASPITVKLTGKFTTGPIGKKQNITIHPIRNSFPRNKNNTFNSIQVSDSFTTTEIYLIGGICLVCLILFITCGVILYKLLIEFCLKMICKGCNCLMCCCIKKSKVKLSPSPSANATPDHSICEIESIGSCHASVMSGAEDVLYMRNLTGKRD